MVTFNSQSLYDNKKIENENKKGRRLEIWNISAIKRVMY